MRTVLITLILIVLNGCALKPSSTGPHVLNNTYWTADGQPLKESELFQEARQADVVFLAEKHDNTHHHALQQRLLMRLSAQTQLAVGMEMFSRDQTSLLMRYMAPLQHSPPMTPDQLRKALDLSAEAMRWQQYGPILETLRQTGGAAFGIDLPIALRTRFGALGKQGLLPVERIQLPETGPSDPQYRHLMYERIKAAHCGWGPESYLKKLFTVWEVRNQTMAEQIARMLESDYRPIVVIVGNGHTDYNLGVVRRLAALRPSTRIFNVGLLETYPDALRPEDYLNDDRLPKRKRYDAIYLAPAAEVTKDLCKAFRARQHSAE